jgi:uncharacterized surface protein with fasciclin (FAS1) repeats
MFSLYANSRRRGTDGAKEANEEIPMMMPKIATLAAAAATAVFMAGTAARAADADIVDTAVANGNFTTLAAALEAAGLVETLKGEGPFTVFAPTDEAFAKLPEGTVATLLEPENKDQLTAILTYHVVPGEVTAEQVTGMTEAETVNGKMIEIDASNGAVMVNDATVTTADVMATNGVIHVIDSVILPPDS